ncbi:hypothetical protein DL89DRAFT_32446 [Linderina pennispora]|uniref:Uncharacterized protein n=1 Tax=Linderina pennispora TaxID=61395 RepID=A0A1Y1W4G0_9FUNG|nr:uncharacterized protein DL89DRAFT_32446 [Linderina pennispora]ORX68367.1 hypothetical protein DL89DRAFT_32446 [Linderina pennispora]
MLGPRLTHQEQPFIDYSNMYDSLSDGTLDRTDDYHYRSPYTSSTPVPQSCPQPHLVYSDNSHSVRRLPNNDGLRMQPSSSSSQPAYLASSSTHLLNSIEECLNEDGFAIAGCPSRMDVDEREDGGPSAVVSGAVDAANLSFIFDESDGHDDYPRDLIGNISNTALSAFASHIFSSNPDMASARHVGERTVSDFNNSVYHRHRPLHLPSADRHVSFGDLGG